MEPEQYQDNYYQTNNFNYGSTWITNKEDPTSLKELGDNAIKLRYLKKAYKSQRKIEQDANDPNKVLSANANEKYKVDKNALVFKKFPFQADQFKYPHDGKPKPQSLYIKASTEYGSKKPNDLELPGIIKFILNFNFITKFREILSNQ